MEFSIENDYRNEQVCTTRIDKETECHRLADECACLFRLRACWVIDAASQDETTTNQKRIENARENERLAPQHAFHSMLDPPARQRNQFPRRMRAREAE